MKRYKNGILTVRYDLDKLTDSSAEEIKLFLEAHGVTILAETVGTEYHYEEKNNE